MTRPFREPSVERSLSSNDRNVSFYNAIDMRAFARSAGLDACPDLETMESALVPDRRQSKVLEVGAGYGRVARRLLDTGYTQVFALERSTAATGIEEELSTPIADGRLTVLKQDVRRFETHERFDLILWMFSGIADFSPWEQVAVLAKLASHLAPGGSLVLDLPPDVKSNATRVEGKTQVIEIEGLPSYHGTVPTGIEIQRWASGLGFSSVQRVGYQPLADQPERDRSLFVLGDRDRRSLAARAA